MQCVGVVPVCQSRFMSALEGWYRAYHGPMCTTTLPPALCRASNSPDVRAVLLAGNGAAFCGGIDLRLLMDTFRELKVGAHLWTPRFNLYARVGFTYCRHAQAPQSLIVPPPLAGHQGPCSPALPHDELHPEAPGLSVITRTVPPVHMYCVVTMHGAEGRGRLDWRRGRLGDADLAL
jgi:hypothetical protein